MLGAYKNIMSHELNPLSSTILGRTMATLAEMPHRALKEYPKQPYGVTINQDGEVRVLKERVVERLPFCNLVGFPIEGAQERPKVLIAAAMSGHYATLLRDTVRGFARDFDPYITDWKNARDVPLSEGDFGLDDYVTYLTEFMAKLGPGTHLVATCQAAPPALIAAAALAERDPSLVPASLTLMAGPMDTRINKNLINKVTDVVPLSLMQANNIKTVPYGFAGAGRKVYPGFFQLSGFMSLSLMPHLKKYWSFLNDGIAGDDDASEAFRDFYDEYFAVLDMTESFYIETLQRIFFEHHVPLGKMTYEGAPVNFRALDAMPLLTIEGGKDNMCSIGQTEAAHGLCPNIPDAKRAHHLQEGVGHYGVFSGSKFQDDIYPVARDFIQTHHA
jgi:poly(3-hydroxybutyrate) depolymerase